MVFSYNRLYTYLSLGAIFADGFVSFVCLWLFHCGTFVWGVVWPYHYSIARSLGRTKYYHISAAVISVFLPLIAVTAVYASDEISITLVLVPICGPGSPELYFYGFVIPIGLIIITGVALLILTCWSIADMVSAIFITTIIQ